ncbi:hypothetical protein [Pseudobutyrivibrio sp.]|uniref:hypothetical protein n=1 Tax=Pseudobutyrivibrio sp. TaxID=2014367 RepID=UPI001D871A08|nr:hypothetical protein [Pseudobutyrivibrio sp.]MBE5909765.1 endolytic transglycosylase MltG [Pseudobutyrivibrio sp.]
MRLKYYLRGIGAGIILATLLLTLSFYFNGGYKSNLSDEEIIARAQELGMTMSEDQETSEQTEAETEQQPEDEAEDTEATPEESVPEDATEVEETLDVEIPDNESLNGDSTVSYIPFSVRSGESSEIISNNLYSAGLIDDATAFNKYLNELGVDDRIPSGSFYIKADSEYDDIVAVLVNKEVRTTTPPAE